jgi:hypothetical protein
MMARSRELDEEMRKRWVTNGGEWLRFSAADQDRLRSLLGGIGDEVTKLVVKLRDGGGDLLEARIGNFEDFADSHVDQIIAARQTRKVLCAARSFPFFPKGQMGRWTARRVVEGDLPLPQRFALPPLHFRCAKMGRIIYPTGRLARSACARVPSSR